MNSKLFIALAQNGQPTLMQGTVTKERPGGFFEMRFEQPKKHRRILTIQQMQGFAFFDDQEERDAFREPVEPPKKEDPPPPPNPDTGAALVNEGGEVVREARHASQDTGVPGT